MFFNIVLRLVVITTNNSLAVRYVWLLYLKLQDQVFFAIFKQSKTSISFVPTWLAYT